MNWQRGLFRIWLVVTAAALIGPPVSLIFPLWDGPASSTCFGISDFRFNRTIAPNQVPSLDTGGVRPTICTDPSRADQPENKFLETYWKNLESLKVAYSTGEVETVFPAKMESLSALYFYAETLQGHADYHRALKDASIKAGVDDGFILILATALWWLGRFLVVLTHWIRRGFFS